MRRMRWTGHVASMERRKGHTIFRWEKLNEKEHLEDQDIDGRIILIWMFRKRDGGEDWIDVAQDRDRRRAILNRIISFPVA
jgi:hypothetical protein